MLSLRNCLLRLCLFLLLGTLSGHCEPLTFERAIQLALTHSPAIGIASADILRAQQAYLEARNAYLPNVVLGSGIGYSYGYPLSIEGSAPTIFNVNYQSTLWSPSLKEFVKAGKLDWISAQKDSRDRRREVILDTSLAYIQLDKLFTELKILKSQGDEANKLSGIVAQRVQQGVDPQVELTKSKLLAARVRMREADLQGNIDVLRQKLAELTGLPAQSIETDTESVPRLPEVDQQADLAAKALENSSAVKVAADHADAQEHRAKGEHNALYPSFDLAAQYGLFSNYNNYEDFFRKFQRNNATFGVGIRFPFLNFAQRARAAGADADAIKARRQVDQVKNQVSEETLKLQRAVRQLAAAQEVAQLEYQLAQSEVESTQIRAQAAANAPNSNQTGPAQTVTARDVSNARLQAGDKYSQYLDTTFEYDKARLQLLRATGELDEWAKAPQ
jgi:outer membrane protein TolC